MLYDMPCHYTCLHVACAVYRSTSLPLIKTYLLTSE